MSTTGVSFAGKTALVTGCGRGSIGADILCGLLAGGARVVATTSSYSRKTTLFYEEMYREHGARGSELIVVPFNQGSTADITALVEYIYSDASGSKGLGWDLDFVIPFAAISEIGNDIAGINSRSELAHRVMLTNLLRLLGEIKEAKDRLGYVTHPSLVVLPLSPNHGDSGGDGLYGESKAGLETAFSRWQSEAWAEYLSIAGAVIGWTRGTQLMSGNNVFAHKVEKIGARTFSTKEMAFNILGLLHPIISALAEAEPVWADLNGGLQFVSQLDRVAVNARASLLTTSNIVKTVCTEHAHHHDALKGGHANRLYSAHILHPLANHKYPFPAVKSYEQLEHLRHLQGMVNLDKVIVVTGYGEVGPFGNAEHRWEMEAFGEFSLEGCIELAWIMGLIKHHNGLLKSTGTVYIGWVDAKSGKPVKDIDIKERYEDYILDHTGIRLIEPEMVNGYNPSKKQFLRELQIEHNMEPFEATSDEADAFKHQNGDRVDVWENKDSTWSVRFLKGAIIRVPKALRFDRIVAAQIPTGWDPARYGIPDDIVRQVDLVTCYALVATVEALVRSGITDPYELYRYFHVSEVGNTISTAVGGANKAQDVFKNRFLDRELQGDVLQEVFINTTAAWVNMLLMSSSGPIKPTVGACSTSVLSIEVAAETIQTGKAKVVLAGGLESFIEESSYEFAQMGATCNSLEELASGRTPKEMCRPCTSTRSGFMEGEGAGVVTLMSASAAIEFGAPIYGIVAMSGTATDKQGKSVPAPGQGILTSARQLVNAGSEPLLDISYRRRRLDCQLAAVDQWIKKELESLESGTRLGTRESIACEASRERVEALDMWGNEFWKRNPQISPLRGSLAVWGLTVDDIGVASFHGTSTVANDKNESEVLNRQMEHLGRTPGLAVPAVCQKWLTGHSKGAAAAFMLNGVLQSLRTGIVPGNRNADNIAAELEKFEYIVYPSRSIQTPGIKAGLLKSFGFGQVGGEVLVVHPDYLLAVLTREQLDEYNDKLRQRETKSYRYWQDTLVGNHPFVQVKSAPPYTVEQEQQVYLDPLARAEYDSAAKQYKF
ncbi:thiolase-like protein [Martensiomyces pterosporus]|nr:thiolase-like protein [Martensiomyces pterosporus]